MGRFSRQEIEEAFENYQRVALRAGTTGDWDAWADLFTEDATYVEHAFGTLGGREAIRRWITTTMAQPPNAQMRYYPVEWYVIDEDRGWVVAGIQNRMEDPGDGRVYQAINFRLLKYAGNGRWSYEEDIYNPLRFSKMIQAWQAHRAELGSGSRSS